MTLTPSCATSARPRWATPAVPGRDNFAPKMGKVARGLGFRGLMLWQVQAFGTGTEVREDGLPAYREVVIEVPRQQAKSFGALSLMLGRGLETPGTMISYSAQTRLAGRRRML